MGIQITQNIQEIFSLVPKLEFLSSEQTRSLLSLKDRELSVLMVDKELPTERFSILQSGIAFSEWRAGAPVIQIHRKRWKEMQDPELRMVLLFHGLCVLKGIERTGDYPLSISFQHALRERRNSRPDPAMDLSEGALITTNRFLDFTIRGKGHFILQKSEGTHVYTRAGYFLKNAAGVLVNSDQYPVLGYAMSEDGIAQQALQRISLGKNHLYSPPQKTTQLRLAVNLDATIDPSHRPFQEKGFVSAELSSQWFVESRMFSELGDEVRMRVFFLKSSDQDWNYYALATNHEGSILEGRLEFDQKGELVQRVVTKELANTPVELKFVQDSTTHLGDGFETLTLENDGRGRGSLQHLYLTRDGRIRGHFSNGHQRDLYQIALADLDPLSLAPKEGFFVVDGKPLTIARPLSPGFGAVQSQVLPSRYLISCRPDFSQGAFESSSNPLDLALAGEGFFIFKDQETGENLYSRIGSLQRSETGAFVSSKAPTANLMGRREGESGEISSQLDSILLPNSSPPSPTRLARITMNFAASAPLSRQIGDKDFHHFSSFRAAQEIAQFSLSFYAYDSLGRPHTPTIYFLKIAKNEWEYRTLRLGKYLVGYQGPEDGTVQINRGILQFDQNGDLQDQSISVNPQTDGDEILEPGEETIEVAFRGAHVLDAFRTHFVSKGDRATTQRGAEFYIYHVERTGAPRGQIEKIEILSDGLISAHFSSGAVRSSHMIPLASFENPDGLEATPGLPGFFRKSEKSGEASISLAERTGLGSIRSYAREKKTYCE